MISLIAPIRSFGFKIIIVGVLLSAFQQFVGINVVLYYAPEIFKSMGSGTDTALLQTIIVGIINLSFTVLAILTVDSAQRGSASAAHNRCAGNGFGYDRTGYRIRRKLVGRIEVVFHAALYGRFRHVVGSGLLGNAGRDFSHLVRSSVMSIAVAAQWVSNFLVSWTFPMLNKNELLVSQFNHGFSYWVYGLMGILAAIFI